jgi:Tfp pilus assembly protein PilX
MSFLRRLLRRQDGITLVMSIGILGVLTMTGTALIYYSSTNARTAEYSDDKSSAYDLAEAGINEMMAILSRPENNSLNKYLLGYQNGGTVVHTTHTYDRGTVEWWGTLDEAAATWALTSVGRIKNSTGSSAADATRTLSAQVPVTPTTTQPLNNPSWNYIYSTRTGNLCDMTLDNTVSVKTRLYVAGNLCLKQSANIVGGTNVSVVVRGSIDQYSSQNFVGSSTTPVHELSVGNGCEWFNNTAHSPCQNGAGSSGFDNVWASTITSNPVLLQAPVADWDGWYLNASPGPYYPCTTQSGTVPTFDNDQGSAQAPDVTKRNTSVAGVFNLVGSSSYTCKTAGGELSWNPTSSNSDTYGPAKTLTIRGTIFIDGYVKIEPSTAGTTYQYSGQGALYVSGTVVVKNVDFCGGVTSDGSDCDFSAWDPNTELLTFVANGSGGQTDVGSGVSIEIKSAHFQGALYGTNKIQLDTSSKVDGPLVGSEVVLGQSIQTDDFQTITTVPVGMPGNPAVYAQPNPPRLYSG